MAKGQKSSASSGTRKKHARRAGGEAEHQLPLPKEKKTKTKGKNQQQRTKIFIPPSKPAPVRPDPLESMGLANQLSPEMLVVLKRLGKKDSVTKRKALEDLQTGWIDRMLKEDKDAESIEATLITSLPVWLHYVPALLLNSSRRIRLLAAGIHASLLQIESIHEQLIFFLRESGSTDQVEAVLGSWCMAAKDVDRTVVAQAKKARDLISNSSVASMDLDENSFNLLLGFIKRALFDPAGVYAELNPSQRSVAPNIPAHASPRAKSGAKQSSGVTPAADPVADDSQTRRDDDEENDGDRKARFRVGALGVLSWVIEQRKGTISDPLAEILSSPLLWTGLYHGSNPPFCATYSSLSGFIGDGQPNVRKAAWDVVFHVLKYCKGEVERSLLPLTSTAILRSAWVEPDSGVRTCMWEPLLLFLTQFPKSWGIDRDGVFSVPTSEENEGEGNEDAEENEDEGDAESDASGEGNSSSIRTSDGIPSTPSRMPYHSEAYREFLQFLQLGCYGSPTQGYPTVVIILSTIPPSACHLHLWSDPEEWADLFISFWAALDGRALSSLERTANSAAFMSSLHECLILLIKRSRGSLKDASEDEVNEKKAMMNLFINGQMSRNWEELVSERLRADTDTAGKVLAQTLASLENLDDALFASAWDPIASSVLASCKDQRATSSGFSLQLVLLKALVPTSRPGALSRRSLMSLVYIATGALCENCETHLQSQSEESIGATQRLTEILQIFGTKAFGDSVLAKRIDELVQKNLSMILTSDPKLLLAYLALRNDTFICSSTWNAILKTMASDLTTQMQALPILLGGAETGMLPSYLKPDDDEMDKMASRLIAIVIGGDEQNEMKLTTARRLLMKPGKVALLWPMIHICTDHIVISPKASFISRRSAAGLLHSIAFAFSERARAYIRGTSTFGSMFSLNAPLTLISSTIKARPEAALSEEIRAFLPEIFGFGFLIPHSDHFITEAEVLCAQARAIWKTASSADLSPELHDELFASVRAMLRELISDVDCRLSPDAVLKVIAEGDLGSSYDILEDFFPSEESLDNMLNDLPSNPPDPVLAIVDPLVPPPSMWKAEAKVTSLYDITGMSEYARVVNALLSVATNNRYLARSNIWLLRHFLTLSLAASEQLMLRTEGSAFFSQEVSETTLRDIDARVKTLTSFILANVNDEGWHAAVIQAYLNGNVKLHTTSVKENTIVNFVVLMLSAASKDDTVRESRVLFTVMRHILNGALTADAEQWMVLSRRLEMSSPNTALAVVLAVTEIALEPPTLLHYRNELAAGVLGVRLSKANTEGLSLLRRLTITAPNPESDVVFLAQNRAMNFMKVCQTWITSEEEDISEEVESEMTLIFQHLAPILQNVPGSHWELIFDVIENNLENCSFADSSSLLALARTFKLILTVQDLVRTNKALRAVWNEHELAILTLVRDLVQKTPVTQSSASVPRSVCWEMAFSIMQNLPPSLIDHESLPKMAHLLMDPSTDVVKMAYALLRVAAGKRTEHLVMEAGIDTSDQITRYDLPKELLLVLLMPSPNAQPQPNILSYLLGWMIVFDSFMDASLRVKIGYATQLRDLNLISSNFLPIILELLEITGGRSKSFSIDIWSVEEYFVQLYDSASPLSAKLLGAHLLYRALFHVPSLISTWWGDCKDRQLTTAVATLTTKYYSPVLIASELGHVKDPAGVQELSGENWSIKVATGTGEVTALYTVDEQEMEIAVRLPPDYPLHSIENGRIVDGLSMFKKNVTHHFENQTECAICYSIISVTELSLPKKRCRTCKNRFHSGCLYKWFSTSHTSSCPLCRSDFI
ncbi:hypothetical protein EW145_g5943 [Phellinidium pouzarii]|uniref:E3 ubiquitin-protein ligase listerin n=1 Tax=Phellinidium pouzarii TaxID=167371 RepID=A0A4S4KZH2_9AGAM|nr:hypothetical protein EW145_g5943 [Phellinidium pouzarii]